MSLHRAGWLVYLVVSLATFARALRNPIAVVVATAALAGASARARAEPEPRDWSVSFSMGYPHISWFRVDHMPSRNWRIGADLGGFLSLGSGGAHLHWIPFPHAARVYGGAVAFAQVLGPFRTGSDPSPDDKTEYGYGAGLVIGVEWAPRGGFRAGLELGAAAGRWAVEPRDDLPMVPLIAITAGYAW